MPYQLKIPLHSYGTRSQKRNAIVVNKSAAWWGMVGSATLLVILLVIGIVIGLTAVPMGKFTSAIKSPTVRSWDGGAPSV